MSTEIESRAQDGDEAGAPAASHAAPRVVESVDLSAREREPIHIPGSIQPNGMLLALSEPELTALQASESVTPFLGIPSAELLGRPLDELVIPDDMRALRRALAAPDLATVNPLRVTLRAGAGGRVFDGVAHRSGGALVLELEPANADIPVSFVSFYHRVKDATARLQRAETLGQLCAAAAREVRSLTGFDRVMIYRFSREWNGEVIAEDKRDDLAPYLGLRYPAGDILAEAPALYTRNWLRFVVDVNATPSPLIPTDNPLTGQPLDLSFSVLRTVSPAHIEYLKNTGVGAAMYVSILNGGALWGLISCHHQTAKAVPYELRAASEFLGQVLSTQLAAHHNEEEREFEQRQRAIRADLVAGMTEQPSFVEGMLARRDELLEMVSAQGAAVSFGGRQALIGETPTADEVAGLVTWLRDHEARSGVFATDWLAGHLPAAERFKDKASGVLAISIAGAPDSYVLWFRPGVVQTVNWGGRPGGVAEEVDDALRLQPRTSFESGTQTVREKALPWTPSELEAARELRAVITSAALLRVVRELAEVNDELARSNAELDSFAYIASHDLREPLRGIYTYASMLLEDQGDRLDETGTARVHTLMTLSQRMEGLLEALLHFSRVGRLDLAIAPTDLNAVLADVLLRLRLPIEETKTEIRIPRPLPTLVCDRVRIGEVFYNLISNALKYNDKPERWVEIGYLTPQERVAQASAAPDDAAPDDTAPDHAAPERAVDVGPGDVVFYVRDNGIGIREKHLEIIFRIFKRLHPRDKFGGGAGAGLTIARRIVERHGGELAVRSTFGEGTTFSFNVPQTRPRAHNGDG